MSKQKEFDRVGFPGLLTLLLIGLKCTGHNLTTPRNVVRCR